MGCTNSHPLPTGNDASDEANDTDALGSMTPDTGATPRRAPSSPSDAAEDPDAVDAAVALAEKAMALRDHPSDLTVREVRDAAVAMQKNIEVRDRTRFGRAVAAIASAASKVDVLCSIARVIPVVGPSVGGMLNALATVCEVAERYCHEEKDALKLLERM